MVRDDYIAIFIDRQAIKNKKQGIQDIEPGRRE